MGRLHRARVDLVRSSFESLTCPGSYLLESYPTLRAEDLSNAWSYVRSHREQIERAIKKMRMREVNFRAVQAGQIKSFEHSLDLIRPILEFIPPNFIRITNTWVKSWADQAAGPHF